MTRRMPKSMPLMDSAAGPLAFRMLLAFIRLDAVNLLAIEYGIDPMNRTLLLLALFHFGEYTVGDVKKFLATKGVPVRLTS